MKKRIDNKGRKLKEGESQRKDGMYQFRYLDEEGNQKTLYSWKLTAQDKVPVGKRNSKCLRELELEAQRKNRNVACIEKTVSESVKEVLAMRTDYAMNTRVGFERILRVHMESSTLGNKLITEVTKSDILKFYSFLAEKKNLGFSIIRSSHTLLNSVFQIAIKDGIISQNPCIGCLKECQNKVSKRTALTIQEQHSLLNFLKSNISCYHKYYEIIAVFLGTGLRISEFIGLSWDEIDLEGHCIHLKHQLLYDEERRTHFISSLKNGTPRLIPLPSALIKIFEKYLKEIDTYGPAIDGVSGFIFLNKNHDLYRIGTLNSLFHRIVARFNKTSKDSKLPDLSAHVFRHTYCTRIIELGVDLKVVQEIMGHSTARVTLDIYTHLNKEQIHSEVYKVEEIDLGE